MRNFCRGLLVAAAVMLLPTAAVAADPAPAPAKGFTATPPAFPTPVQSAILGLALTAVVTVGARATQRTPNTMMYMVLSTVAVTGIFVAASYRIHTQFDRAVYQKLVEMQQTSR